MRFEIAVAVLAALALSAFIAALIWLQ
jgi:hypothetical protein